MVRVFAAARRTRSLETAVAERRRHFMRKQRLTVCELCTSDFARHLHHIGTTVLPQLRLAEWYLLEGLQGMNCTVHAVHSSMSSGPETRCIDNEKYFLSGSAQRTSCKNLSFQLVHLPPHNRKNVSFLPNSELFSKHVTVLMLLVELLMVFLVHFPCTLPSALNKHTLRYPSTILFLARSPTYAWLSSSLWCPRRVLRFLFQQSGSNLPRFTLPNQAFGSQNFRGRIHRGTVPNGCNACHCRYGLCCPSTQS